MYWVDIVAIILTLFFIYRSYQQGLLTSAVRLAGIILGIIVSANLGSWASDLLMLQFNWSEQVSNIVGYIAIFFIVLMMAQILGYFLRTIIHAIKLGWLDRIGGLLLGALKAGIIISLIFWVLLIIPSDSLSDEIQERSFSYKILGGFAPSLYEKYVLPNIEEGEVKNRIDSMISPDIESLNIVDDFEEQVSEVKGANKESISDLKTRFNELPLSKQMEVMSKLGENKPDLQEIINILYTETP